MGTDFLKGDFNAPALHDPGQDVQRVSTLVSRKESRRGELTERVAHQYPTDGQGVVTGGIPQGCASGNLKGTLSSAIPDNLMGVPKGGRVAPATFQGHLTW